jgi:tetratricopeptide (TPR) repeat protein
VADIFVSYTGSDRDWAFWIAKELEALGHTPHVHEWEIGSGDDIYAWMEQRHEAAEHVLCVVSDEYLKAPYSTLERNAALWQAAGNRPGFVLFVTVKPSKLPTLSDHIRRCELFGIPEDAARLRFREFMQKREAPAAAAFPGKVFAVSNIPIRVPAHFLGRQDSLAAIEAAFNRATGDMAVAALHGLRGVGKTTLAAAYAERHRADYRATWWIRAQTEATLRADLVGLGVRLNWIAADEKEEPALTAVVERLRHEGEGILLIYDNAISANGLKPYLPRGGTARVLVTSNAHAFRGVAFPIEIELWPIETGADYLVARTGLERESDAAAALSAALGGLPLAHEQAAAYCERLEISLGEYGKRFAIAPARMLDAERDAPAEYHDRLTVAKTFALAIDEAAKLHAAAEPLIVHAALLSAEPVPLFLFAEAREKFSEPLPALLADDGMEEAVAALRSFALVAREKIADERDASISTDAIRLHRLVREVAAVRGDGESRRRTRSALVVALTMVYPRDGFTNPASWPRCAVLTQHVMAACDTEATEPSATAEHADLLSRTGGYFHGRAAYSTAKPLYARALEIRETVLGSDHPRTAASLNHLAALLSEQNDFAGARPLYERALAIWEKALGPEHADTASSLNNLAILLSNQGDLAAARPLQERALEIWEKVLGPEHPYTASSLNNLATLLQDQGELAAASPLAERALAIREKVLGPDHPHTALSLNTLARQLQKSGQFSEAVPLFRRAIANGEERLGADHPLTQRFKSEYARALLGSGQPREAHALAAAALAIHAATNGPTHPWTKDSAGVTADALDALGQTKEAAAIRQRYGISNSR